MTANETAGTVPNLTVVAAVKPVPVIVTVVPPVTGPLAGAINVTAGAAVAVNWSATLTGLVIPAAVTVKSTVPAANAGDVAVINESSTTLNDNARTAPNSTPVAPVNPDPLIDTTVPPAVGPPAGDTAETVGVIDATVNTKLADPNDGIVPT